MGERRQPLCGECGQPLDGQPYRVVVVAGVRYHGYCWFRIAPGAPKGE